MRRLLLYSESNVDVDVFGCRRAARTGFACPKKPDNKYEAITVASSSNLRRSLETTWTFTSKVSFLSILSYVHIVQSSASYWHITTVLIHQSSIDVGHDSGSRSLGTVFCRNNYIHLGIRDLITGLC